MEDADLRNGMNLVELEHRCVQLGRAIAEAMSDADYFSFDAETFVVGELIRRALDAEVEPADLIRHFETGGFIGRVCDQIALR